MSITFVDDPLETEFMVLNAPFLIAREEMREFEAAVEELADERQEFMQFRLLGPMPAYNLLEVTPPAPA